MTPNANTEYLKIASDCINHAVDIEFGMTTGDKEIFKKAAVDAISQVRDVPAPIADIIDRCAYMPIAYISEAVAVIKACC